jgi:glucose-1-phosphate thymidylyltransferase
MDCYFSVCRGFAQRKSSVFSRNMKGILLAGGAGSRLYPLTQVASKQLQPVYDKPMVYYPLSILIEGGIREICIISTPTDLPRYQALFGDGSRLGLDIVYREQPRPEGIAQAFLIAADFIAGDSAALILGDNIFYGGDIFEIAFREFTGGATIFGYHVHDPNRYGVVEFDASGKAISLEEKPAVPKSNYAVPGLYLYDNRVVRIAKSLKPSARGELEITDLNRVYLEDGTMRVFRLGRGFAWLDAGTTSSLHDASSFVQTIEKRAGVKIGCPEEAAFRKGFITESELQELADRMPKCEYADYLKNVIAEVRRAAALE